MRRFLSRCEKRDAFSGLVSDDVAVVGNVGKLFRMIRHYGDVEDKEVVSKR